MKKTPWQPDEEEMAYRLAHSTQFRVARTCAVIARLAYVGMLVALVISLDPWSYGWSRPWAYITISVSLTWFAFFWTIRTVALLSIGWGMSITRVPLTQRQAAHIRLDWKWFAFLAGGDVMLCVILATLSWRLLETSLLLFLAY